MGKYLIAHDLGTSANKASLLDLKGNILRSCSEGYPVEHPHPGWAHQDPAGWWQAFCRCNRAILAGVDAAEVAGLAVTGQMMCCLALGREGQALYPAMIWADTRAEEEAAFLDMTLGADSFYRIVGMRSAANYGLPKMMWLRKHEPEIYKNTHIFLTPKDYINYRLTGRMATDPENAAYLHCFDWRRGCWSADLLRSAGVSPEKLPGILPAGDILGPVSAQGAAATGLRAGTPVAVSMGDGGMTTLGAAAIAPGEGYISLGTSSWVCLVTGSRRMDPARGISKLNYLDTLRDSGTMQAGGYSYNWLREALFQPETEGASQTGEPVYALMEAMAAAAGAGAGGVLYLPYLLGERAPLWDARLKGAFLGLTGSVRRGDLARSVLEGVAYHMNSIFQRILAVNGLSPPESLRMVGGGAQSRLWRQIFADVFGVPVTTSEDSDHAGVLGAAALAGTALGVYRDVGVVRDFQRQVSLTRPDPEAAESYRVRYPIFLEAQEALRQVNHKLWALGEKRS